MALKQCEVATDEQNVSAAEVSAAQLAANQSNAQHSTGPRTPEGKARVSLNAVKHGLFARTAADLLGAEPESQAEFDELVEDLMEDCAPEGRCEIDMVERIAALTWRLADLQHKAQLHLSLVTIDEAGESHGLDCAEAYSRMEARTARELARVQRNFAFLQRYKLDFADKVNTHRLRFAQRQMAEYDARVEQMMEATRAEFYGFDKARGSEEEPGESDDGEDTDVAPRASRPFTGDQPLSAESTEQTQSEDAGEASRPRDRSGDLT